MNFVRPWLAIGGLRETYDRRLLSECHIEAVLQLAERVENPDVVSLYLPIDDGEPLTDRKIAQGVRFVQEQHAAGKNVLVACALGISRSVSFAAAALKESEDTTLLEALRSIFEQHAEARPHPVLWQSLCRYYVEDVSYLEVVKLRRSTTETDPNARD